MIIDQLSAGWGTFLYGDGKTVWANLRIHALNPSFPTN